MVQKVAGPLHNDTDELDLAFLNSLPPSLALRLKAARESLPGRREESILLLDLAPYLEDFLAVLFSIQKEVGTLQDMTYTLAPLQRCKRLFVQRQAAKAFSKEEAAAFNGPGLKEKLSALMGEPYTDLGFSRAVLAALDEKNESFLSFAKSYAAWSLSQEAPSLLFRLPHKIDPQALVPLKKEGNLQVSPYRKIRRGFDCTDPGASVEEALDQAAYCIVCHVQEKDSCSTGLSSKAQGCPLGQKISEMNSLRAQGYVLGALAMIMVDNPLVAATGRRICNACRQACIFQKQEAVDVPSIETQTLEGVLNLPWGVEIYALLSRWNPLNLRSPVPKTPTGYKVLIVGIGPAGFTLAHYLLNEGHQVVGIDGLKIDPLDRSLLTQPIHNWQDIKVPLSQRSVTGFGGVAEYGITARWDKNYLTLIRILLERRSLFSFYDGVRLGGNLTVPQAFDLGFDHVALCLGAGKPELLPLKNGLARGVRTAADFLMALQLTGAAQEKSLSNLQIRLPLVVIGGGLTAIDTATEALAYYPVQVEKFLKQTEELGGLPPGLSREELDMAEEFLRDARALRRGDRSCLTQAVTVLYRNRVQDSPAYLLNAEELDLGLREGIAFLEQANLEKITVDAHGHIDALVIATPESSLTLPCRTLLVAIGSQPNATPKEENFLIGEKRVSLFGDLDPLYQGSVVGAMASAKNGYSPLSDLLKERPPTSVPDFLPTLDHLFQATLYARRQLTPTIGELIIKAPQAVRNFKPGQFFRLQNYGLPAMEALALTGAHVDKEKGLLSLIVLERGSSTSLCHSLQEGERLLLMGPTGTPTVIPHKKTILLLGEGLGNAVFFSIGRALKDQENRVIYVAGYKTPEDRVLPEAIEAVADHVIWCSEAAPGFTPGRPQDRAHRGTLLEGLLAYAKDSPPLPLSEVTHLLTSGSETMMAAVARGRGTVLKPYLNPAHEAMGSINSPMQCMMKGLCGQCIQLHTHPVTQKTQVVFSCIHQDQLLDHVDFKILEGRMKQNSLLEKMTSSLSRAHKGPPLP